MRTKIKLGRKRGRVMGKRKKITLCGAKLSEGCKCEHAHCCTLSDKCEFGVYAVKCKRLLESEGK